MLAVLNSSNHDIFQLACTSFVSGIVSVWDLKTNTLVKRFDTAKFEGRRPYVYYFKEKDAFVSIHYSELAKKATFEVFSATRNFSEVYNYGLLEGDIGSAGLAYDRRSNLLALLPITNKVRYHIFNLETLEIISKVSWDKEIKDDVEGLDIDPLGKNIASIDRKGLLLVSDFVTGQSAFNYNLAGEIWWFNRCHWNPDPTMHTIAVKYSNNKVNFINSEKQALSLKDPLDFKDSACSNLSD